MATKTTIRFELYTTRTNKAGLAPIRIVYALKGHKKYISTLERVWPGNWNVKTQHTIYLSSANAKDAIKTANKENKSLPETDLSALPLKKDIDFINANLAAAKQKIRAIENNFELNNKDYQLQDVIDIFNEKENDAPQAIKTQPKVFIVDYIEDYIRRNENTRDAGTLQTYNSLALHLAAFAKKKADRVTFAGLTRQKLDELLKYYVKEGLYNSTISKQFSLLKRVIRLAIAEDNKLEVNPAFRDFTHEILRRRDGDNEVIALEEQEFNAIMDLDLSDYSQRVPYTKKVKGKEKRLTVSYQTLDKVKDLYIFSCTSGFRYSDLATLKREHIRKDFIIKKQVKGGSVSNIELPLNAITSYILYKYKEQPLPLPIMTDQKCNDFIKIICRIAGIDSFIEINRKSGTKVISQVFKKYEKISMHTGRKTFSTLTLQKGVAIQDVMSLTGHKKFASFKRYMDITKKQKQKAMNVWGEIEPKENHLRTVK